MGNGVNRKALTSWDELIQDAKRQFDAAKKRGAELRKTIRKLEVLRDSGHPWPNKSANTT
jgi:hypothetical protein